MDAGTIGEVLWLRRRLRRRERWTRARLLAHQRRQLARLRRFAVAKSRFYRELHRGREGADLSELPPVTKAMLMDNFDAISTARGARLADLESYLEGLRDNERFAGRYWVSATSGSSGRRSVIPNSRSEWSMMIASYARANAWAGITAGPAHRVTMAVVSSTTAWHQSARVAATIRSPFIRSDRIDAAAPLAEIVERLNRLRPEVLIGYASMIRILADEQLAGRLVISPRAVNSSSEVLTAEARAMAVRAWGGEPFDVYAATETGGIAAECAQHHGLHLFEDLVIPEVVDENYQPVPPGVTGDRLLVTVLFSRTVPLIRYELTDRIRLATRRCGCRLPFRLAETVEGRTDDVLRLPAQAGGSVRIHPVVFHRVLDLLDVAGWQVRQEAGGLTVLVAGAGGQLDPGAVVDRLRGELQRAGVGPLPVRLETVGAIPPGAAGKRPLVLAERAPGITQDWSA